jgi:hypothetical protein
VASYQFSRLIQTKVLKKFFLASFIIRTLYVDFLTTNIPVYTKYIKIYFKKPSFARKWTYIS